MLLCITLCRRSLMLMLPRTTAARGGLTPMSSRTALGRRELMLMSGLGFFFGQVRRDALDAKGTDRRHYDWRRGSSKGAGGVIVGDLHRVIAWQQKTQTQQGNCALQHFPPYRHAVWPAPLQLGHQGFRSVSTVARLEGMIRPFAAVEGAWGHRGALTATQIVRTVVRPRRREESQDQRAPRRRR